MQRHVLIFVSVLLVVIGLLFMQKTKNKQLIKKTSLTIPIHHDIISFDINSQGHDVNAGPIKKLLFEGLMSKDEKGVPNFALAKKVGISLDQKIYTFHLRESNWSDGEKVTAHDFEYSWKRALNPKSKYMTQCPYYFYSIKNAKKCLFNEKSIDEVGVKALDNQTLIVELEHPDPYFLDLVANCLYYPIPKHIVEKDPEWATKLDLVSNGPFILEEWKHNYSINLKRNPHYWNQKNIYLEKIYVLVIPSDFTALQMFEKGNIDWFGEPLYRVSSDFYRSFKEKNLIHEEEGNAIYWVFLNADKYPLTNKKLRKALSYAIDRDSIVRNVFYGFGSPARGVLSPPLRVTNKKYFEDNVQAAQKLFEEALDELDITKDSFPVLEFSCVADVEIHNRISQALQDQWRKNLGIQISIKKTEWHTFYNAVSQGNYDMGFMSWRIDIPNPVYLLNSFKNKNDVGNKSFWENAEFQKTVDEIENALGDIERIRSTSKAESILMDEMPVIPLIFLKQVYIKNPDLKGEKITAFPPIDFRSVYFEKKVAY